MIPIKGYYFCGVPAKTHYLSHDEMSDNPKLKSSVFIPQLGYALQNVNVIKTKAERHVPEQRK